MYREIYVSQNAGQGAIPGDGLASAEPGHEGGTPNED